MTVAAGHPPGLVGSPPEPDPEFLVRHRLPRPLSRAYEAVRFALGADEELARSRWCARVALRFVAALRQAGALAADPTHHPTPPGHEEPRRRTPGHLVPAELGGGLPYALSLLAGVFGLREVANPRQELLQALAELGYLARCRIAVVEPAGLRVLLGPRIEAPLPGELPAAVAALPTGTPLLCDPQAGLLLTLAPLFAWRPGPGSGFGRLGLLRRVRGERGDYGEEGRPGCPGCSAVLDGRPEVLALPRDWAGWSLLRSPPARFADGSQPAADLLVAGLIWRGGTSEVYAARTTAGEQLVLKTFEYEPGVYDENFWRFFEEERLSARVAHPLVLRLTSRRLAGGLVHLQEWIPRGSLADLIETNGVLPRGRALELSGWLLQALQAVHAAGILHNDVKPDNLLFDDEGRVRLIDFGIATSRDSPRWELRPGVPAGTPGYVAPEVVAGEPPTPQSDLYAAGVVLLRMLGGTPPAPGDPLASLPAGLGPEVSGFLTRCLAPSPAARFPTLAAAAAELGRLQAVASSPTGVALDIEGTLVTSYQEGAPRPGLADFLDFCLRSFTRVFLYTLVPPAEVRQLLARLVAAGTLAREVTARLELVDWPRGEDGSLKDLRRCGLPVESCAIVDDAEPWIPEDQAHRWIPVAEYNEPNPFDRGLAMAEVKLRRRFDLP